MPDPIEAAAREIDEYQQRDGFACYGTLVEILRKHFPPGPVKVKGRHLPAPPEHADQPPAEPDDTMPVFVLKAKDNLAMAAIRAYKDECVAHQLFPQAAEVVKAMREIESWRSRNGDKLKYPDHNHVPAGQPGSGSDQPPTEPAWVELPDDFTTWAYIVEMINQNVPHKTKGFRLGDMDWFGQLEHLQDEVKELKAAATQREAQEEIADVLGVVFHMAIFQGDTPQTLNGRLFGKLRERFEMPAPPKGHWRKAVPSGRDEWPNAAARDRVLICTVAGQVARIAELESDRNALVAALQPFADLCDGDLSNVGDGTALGFDGRLTAGMIKRAKAALSPAQETPNGQA